jgi:hypothetical protein
MMGILVGSSVITTAPAWAQMQPQPVQELAEPTPKPDKYPRPTMYQGASIWMPGEYPDAHYGPWQPAGEGKSDYFPKFTYLGKFGFPPKDTVGGTDKTVGFNRGGFSVGGTDPKSGSTLVWMTTHMNKGRGYMVFALPEPLSLTGTPKAKQLSPWMPVYGEGKQFVLYDVFYDKARGRVVTSGGSWYNAAGKHKDYIHVTDIDLNTWKRSNVRDWRDIEGQGKTIGHVSATPDYLVDELGPYYMNGFTWQSIISQYSPGSSLSGWDGVVPESGRVNVAVKFQYDLNTLWGEHGNGRYKAGDETMTPAKPWTMIATRLTRMGRGFFYNGHLWYIGTTAGSVWGQWYGHNGYFKGVHCGHPDNLGTEASPAKKKNDVDCRCAYWGFPIYDQGRGALDAKHPGDTQPSEWGYLETVLPEPRFWNPKNTFFDYDTNRLYILQGGGKPEIFVFEVQGASASATESGRDSQGQWEAVGTGKIR